MTNRMAFFGLMVTAVLAVGAVIAAQHDHGASAGARPTPFGVPESLKLEHEELHRQLAAATAAPGRTGEAARRVDTLLRPHFLNEELFALPPLGLLVPLASGQVSPAMREMIPLTYRLAANMPRMLAEHKAIVAALGELASAGKAEGHPEVVQFAEKLTLHAQNEEQVLYPAALLVGDYLKVRTAR
jgi:hypothetical protein